MNILCTQVRVQTALIRTQSTPVSCQFKHRVVFNMNFDLSDCRIVWLIWLFFKYLLALVLFILRLFDCGSPVRVSGWVSGLVVFFHKRTEVIWSAYYSVFNTEIFILDWFWNTTDVALDAFTMLVTVLYEFEYLDILITFLFLNCCGDFANLYCEIKVRALYRQTRNELNRKYYKPDFYFPDIINLPKWNKFNPVEEKDKYGAVRCKVMEFITNNRIPFLALWCQDLRTIKILKRLIKEELLKIKKGISQVNVKSVWEEDRWTIVPTPKALKLQNK